MILFIFTHTTERTEPTERACNAGDKLWPHATPSALTDEPTPVNGPTPL